MRFNTVVMEKNRERATYRKISTLGILEQEEIADIEVVYTFYAKTLSGLNAKKVKKTTNMRALISDFLRLFVGNSL